MLYACLLLCYDVFDAYYNLIMPIVYSCLLYYSYCLLMPIICWCLL